MRKRWKEMVEDAVLQIITNEVTKQLEKRFPEVRPTNTSGIRTPEPGFSYGIKKYIETTYEEILGQDEEIRAIVRAGLLRALKQGFGEET